MRQRLNKLRATIWIEEIWHPEKKRHNDESIMDKIAAIPGVSTIQVEMANLCQFYIKLIMVSDISNVNGTAIPPGRMLGQWRRDSNLLWTDIPKPSPTSWEIFLRLMMKSLGTQNIIHHPGANMALRKKLGQWLGKETHIIHTMVRDKDSV